jgi:single-stranded DNA-binding protein
MLNKVQLIGNIAHDLEEQYINSNNEQIPKIVRCSKTLDTFCFLKIL